MSRHSLARDSLTCAHGSRWDSRVQLVKCFQNSFMQTIAASKVSIIAFAAISCRARLGAAGGRPLACPQSAGVWL